MGWLVVGYIKQRPKDPKAIEKVLGVFTPTRCDGVYMSLEMAQGVAEAMREAPLHDGECIDVVEIV